MSASVREQIAALLAEEGAQLVGATVPLTGWADSLADRVIEIASNDDRPEVTR